MIEIIPNHHPIFVHFTLGLLGSSVGLFVLTRIISKPDLKHQLLIVAHWNLWLGTLATIFTIAAGWYAFNTVEHDDPSHEVMLVHRNLALMTFIVVVVLASWSWRKFRPAKQVSLSFLAAAVLAAGLLVSTAWHGAELVFRHGLGVISLPDLDKHRHEGDGRSHDDGTTPGNERDTDDMAGDTDPMGDYPHVDDNHHKEDDRHPHEREDHHDNDHRGDD